MKIEKNAKQFLNKRQDLILNQNKAKYLPSSPSDI